MRVDDGRTRDYLGASFEGTLHCSLVELDHCTLPTATIVEAVQDTMEEREPFLSGEEEFGKRSGKESSRIPKRFFICASALNLAILAVNVFLSTRYFQSSHPSTTSTCYEHFPNRELLPSSPLRNQRPGPFAAANLKIRIIWRSGRVPTHSCSLHQIPR